MRYAGLMKNDIVDSDSGFAVSVWMQGCPHRCKGCHNPETWDFDGGKEIILEELQEEILRAISENGIRREFSILGGEPLCEENVKIVYELLKVVKEKYHDINIYIWTGYTMEELKSRNDEYINYILDNIYCLVDGRFEIDKRDITLKLRGSTNQRIWKNINGELEIVEE